MPFPYLSGLIFGDEQLNLTEHMGNTNTKQTSWWKQGEGRTWSGQNPAQGHMHDGGRGTLEPEANAFEVSSSIWTGSSIREAGLAGGESRSCFLLPTVQPGSVTLKSKPRPA